MKTTNECKMLARASSENVPPGKPAAGGDTCDYEVSVQTCKNHRRPSWAGAGMDNTESPAVPGLSGQDAHPIRVWLYRGRTAGLVHFRASKSRRRRPDHRRPT